MARGTGSTVYLVALIFSILVSLGLLGVSYNLSQELALKDREIVDATRKFENEKREARTLRQELKDVRELVIGDNRAVSREIYENTILDQANKVLQEILSEEWIATEDWKNIQDPQIKKIWEDMAQFKGQSQHFTNLAGLYKELINQLRAVIHIIPRLRYERIRALEEVEAIRQSLDTLRTEKQREIDGLRADLTRVEDEKLDKERRFEQEKKHYQDEKEALLTEMTNLNRDHALGVARLESEKAQLEGRIKDLVKKKTRSFTEYSRPDGEVVYADASLGYAWINLGNAHGVRRNLRFQVYQFIKGGRQRVKGVLEVRKIEGDMAQCAILQNQEVQDPVTGERVVVPRATDPVVKGDLIRNPFFDDQEQKVFVFLGERMANRYYNLAEVKRKITEYGGRVDNDVSIETDFVVVLGEDEATFQAQYDRATQFGVIFMREVELLEYLGR